MSPQCLFMVYGCPLCALTPRPQVCSLFHFTCYLAIVLFLAVAHIVFFFCIPLVSLAM